jgi:hypothetical protein
MSRKSSPKESSIATTGFEPKLLLTADSRSAGETAEGNRSNNMDAAEYSRAERDRSPKATRRVGAEAPINHVVQGLIFLSRAERDRSRASMTRRASRGLRVKYISDTAGKCGMSNAKVQMWT